MGVFALALAGGKISAAAVAVAAVVWLALVGALGRKPWGRRAALSAAVAVALAAVNVFGGFLVTRRMLEMFKKKAPKAGADK